MMKRISLTGAMLAMILCVSVIITACADGFPAGDWAFIHAPEESVLLLREDGTAILKGQECTWTDDAENGFLRFMIDREETLLRYLVTEDKILLYFPAEYVRVKDDPGEGLIGAWIGKESEKSTYIFRGDGMFLEDGTFTGTFRADQETGSLLLVYVKYFDDTLCYFNLEGNDDLKIDYPWPMVETQKTP